MKSYESWGRYIRSTPAASFEPRWLSDIEPFTQASDGSYLAYGRGRSYGDVCLNNGGTLIDMSGLSRFRRFDRHTGVIECEAGTTLDDVLRVAVPYGWFPAVVPGTKFVTVGGCIANDVHGKNHHRAGTFGRWVRSFHLLRSEGAPIRCAPDENAEMFSATIGGLGMTGIILAAEIQLRRIESSTIIVERLPFQSLEEFDALSRDSDATHEYTVAWFDSHSRPKPRGIFFRGNHGAADGQLSTASRTMKIPVAPFSPFLNSFTIRAFNESYFRLQMRNGVTPEHYDPFFFPLDALADWNRIYGHKGFLQYQFVIPVDQGLQPVAEILQRVAATGHASFLTVIKNFGALASPGMLSFPSAGATVCFDFPASSLGLLEFLESLDAIVDAAGGSVYPAKDARMSPLRFKRFFRHAEAFRAHIDSKCSSSFWRRVTG